MDVHIQSSKQEGTNKRVGKTKSSIGGLSSWDPYSKGISSDELKVSLASREPEQATYDKPYERESHQLLAESNAAPSSNEMAGTGLQADRNRTFEDAVKPKHRRRIVQCLS